MFSVDLRSLAAARIGVAALILYDLADRARFLRLHYTDAGIFPRSALAAAQNHNQATWSLHLATGTVAGIGILFVVAALFAVGLLAGYRTKVCAIASFVLLVSLQNRAPAVDYGADALLRALLFFLLFLPIGARFSLDALRSAREGARGAAREPTDEHRSVASTALALQVAAVWIFTALLKLQDPTWQKLTAVYFAVNADHHATHFGLFVGRSLVVTQVLSAGTLFVELGAPLLLLVPYRYWRARVVAFALIAAFHVGTAACLHLGYFPWVSILAWVPLLPSQLWPSSTSSPPSSSPSSSPSLPSAPPPSSMAVAANALRAGGAAIAIVVVLLSNASSLWPSLQLPAPVLALSRVVAMDQHWVMFIRPMHDGWFVVPATLGDGKQIDMLKRGAPVSYDKPAHVADQYPNMRWRKMITDLQNKKASSVKGRYLFLRRLCADWNAGLGDDNHRMQSVDLVFVQQDDRKDGGHTPVLKRTLAHRDCR